MAGERVDRAERDAEADARPERVCIAIRRETRGDSRCVADGVALEIAVVDPDAVETAVARLPRPADHVVDVPARRETEPDRSCQRSHRSPLPVAAPGVQRSPGGSPT